MTLYVPAPPRRIMPLAPKTATYEVHERKASEYEYFVALALEKLDIEYKFQINLLGGRKIKGGFIVDFLALTVPKPTPIWVHGEYWHRGKAREKDLLHLVLLDAMFRGKFNPAIILWGEDLQTEEQAYVAVKKELKV